tara:strand:+ start:2919 stop:3782 length:864 start_codon:yes stop_codon:yes gene_type:complete
MYNVINPIKIKYFVNLIRLNKPIGFLLLMWPCWFALAELEQKNFLLIQWYFYFFIGALLMRSSGCIINDLVDIKIDQKIQRTIYRPLASNKITILESLILLFFLLILSLIILLQFKKIAILFGFLSIPLIIIYPFLKRYTYWPQIGLGLVFSWGILIASMQFYEKITLSYLLLYIGCIFWTLAYDTIYAYQDRQDDIINNIKSTAVLFGNKGKILVKIFYTLFLGFIAYANYYNSQSFLSLITIFCLILAIVFYLNKWDPNSKESCDFYFRFNNIIGLLCFAYLFVF